MGGDLTPIRMAKIKRQTISSVGKDVEKSKLTLCWWNENGAAALANSLAVPQSVKQS